MSRSTLVPSGKRDELITLKKRESSDTPDLESGEPVETWTTLVRQMPASKQYINGDERQRNDQTVMHYDQRWVINYRIDMDPDLVDVQKLRQIVFNGRTLDIVYGQQIDRKRQIALYTLGNGR